VKLVIDWDISAFFGWGIYGLNLALELSRDPTIEARTSRPIDPRRIGIDALRVSVLGPFVARSNQGPPANDVAWLHALGNEVLPERPPQARIGVIFFERPLSVEALARTRGYDLIVTGSGWNESILKAAGFSNTRTILQGVDRSQFFPAPKRNLFPGRFLIFSGGKAEPRKGQDIVVAAFRIFARRHPEAMLVTAWHSPWPQLAQGMDLDLSAFAGRVIDVGALPNGFMAPIYRECDVALFPNRAEGGTNLVAMECLACGVPTILSDNTGHRDLLRMGLGQGLRQRQSPIWSEWGESDVEETVEALERVFQSANPPARSPGLPQWSDATDALMQVVRDIYRE
jgi:glycosyltransferase involved in cell wall biosynthesis